jgi:hypothetical protein
MLRRFFGSCGVSGGGPAHPGRRQSHGVRLVLDPFRLDEPVLFLVLPFYAYLFGVLLLGIVIGGPAVWVTQARWRRTRAARRGPALAGRGDRLSRERQAQVATAGRQLAPANR